jgi:hypothetical protein
VAHRVGHKGFHARILNSFLVLVFRGIAVEVTALTGAGKNPFGWATSRFMPRAEQLIHTRRHGQDTAGRLRFPLLATSVFRTHLAPASEMTSAISRLRKIVTGSGRRRFGEAVGFISLRCCLSTGRSQGSTRTQDRSWLLYYFFRPIEASSILPCLFHPWKRERSPAFHASRSPGVLRSQSGRISLVTARRSCQRSATDGRPQNQ